MKKRIAVIFVRQNEGGEYIINGKVSVYEKGGHVIIKMDKETTCYRYKPPKVKKHIPTK